MATFVSGVLTRILVYEVEINLHVCEGLNTFYIPGLTLR